MDEFESLHEDPETMTGYFHLHILPSLDMLRQQNKLKHGKKKINSYGFGNADYEGEMDENGDCVGIGTAANEHGKYYATWLDNKLQGMSRCSAQPSYHILTPLL